jgi:CDGSH-type Zn-finger protein
MSANTSADGTTIEATKDGPYVVRGPCRLRNAQGEDVPARATFALCRCGNSSKKPFCDGTHAKIGFSGARYAVGPAAPPDEYRGKRITVIDARAICAHSGVCTDNLPAVFRLGTEPWIDPDAAEVENIVERVKACPSVNMYGTQYCPRFTWAFLTPSSRSFFLTALTSMDLSPLACCRVGSRRSGHAAAPSPE